MGSLGGTGGAATAPVAPTTGATGTALATDPLHGSITQSTVLGPLSPRFLQGIGITGTHPGGHHMPQEHAGRGVANVLAGVLPKSELSNVGGLAGGFGATGTHQGAVAPDGSQPKAGSVANLDETSRPDFKNLLPPHHH
jgi:hypothetical protein